MSTQTKPTGEISDFDGGPMPAKGESCTCSHATCACPVHWPLVRIDQPGEWTVEYVARLMSGIQGARAYRVIADAHNAAIVAVEAELTWAKGCIADMQQQLAAEREKVRTITDELRNIVNCDLKGMREDFGNDTDYQFRQWAQNRAKDTLAKYPLPDGRTN